MRSIKAPVVGSALAFLALAPAALGGNASGVTGYALTDAQEIVSFDTAKPQQADLVGSVTGAASPILGIDFRSNGGRLYGVTTTQVCQISLQTAAATCTALSAPLSGGSFGVDFNPTVDRLRVVSDTGNNYRINVDTGGVTVDTPLAYQAGDENFGTSPTITAVAYTNNDNDQFPAPAPAAATGTALYDIDVALNTLAQQVNANGGVLATRGPLGADALDPVGFDIRSEIVDGRATGNTAYASFSKGGTVKLYTIDLATGDASKVAPFGRFAVADIAFPIDS